MSLRPRTIGRVTFGGEVRFGLRRGNLSSGTYLVTGSPRTDDVYVAGREVGQQFKVSLHRSGSWRISVVPMDPTTGEALVPVAGETWEPPQSYAPGLSRVFGVLIPVAAVNMPFTPDPRILLHPAPPDAEAVAFIVVIAEPGALASPWPGAEEKQTTLVGTFTLPESRSTVYVVAQAFTEMPAMEATRWRTAPRPGHTYEDFIRYAREGSLHVVVFGSDNFGMRWYMDSRFIEAS